MLVLQRPIPPQRPRVVGEEILLGKNTRLARLVAVRGFLEIEDWPEDALRALLAQAYGSSGAVLQPLVKAVRAATTLLPRSLIQAANALQGLPEPQADADQRLTQAERLLKAGANPQTLATAMRREGLNLRPAPAWSERLALCDKGVVLGHGTVIVDLTDQSDGSTGLAVEGNEERIVTLLSLGRGELVAPEVLEKFQAASRALAKGDMVHATFLLCHVGQPVLKDRDRAGFLGQAAQRLDKGTSGYALLKAAGLLSAGVAPWAWGSQGERLSPSAYFKGAGEWHEDEHPREGEGAPHPSWFAPKNADGSNNAEDVSRNVMAHLQQMDAVAFVGGAFDQWWGHSVEKAEAKFDQDNKGKEVKYFTHNQKGTLADWIAEQKAAGRTVAVVGHSWGADSAANEISKGAQVDLLVTVDPVGQDLADGYQDQPKLSPSDLPQLNPPKDNTMANVKANTKTWVNIYLSGNPVTPSDGDRIADIGGRYKDRPQGIATHHFLIKERHENFNSIVPKKK